MCKISIALCTYNGAEFLSEQLESYLAQTRLPDELIVGDDGSSDETARLVRDFARRAPFRVELQINERNLGSTENFAQTIARCRGEIIFLSDQDDVWLPAKIEKMTAEFTNAPHVGMVFSDAEIVGEDLAPRGAKLSDSTFTPPVRRHAERASFFESLLPRNYVTGATMAFRAAFRERFAPFPKDIPDMIHDAWIALVVAANADVRFVDEPLVKYRQHARQQLGVFIENRADELSGERYARDLEIARNAKTRIEKILRESENRRPSPFARRAELEAMARRELHKLERRIRHHEARKNLPPSKIKRVAPIARELFSGRYHEVSKGFLSAAKDFLEDV